MRRRALSSRSIAAVALVAGLAAAAGGIALAVIPDAVSGVFHGCYSTKTGALRLIAPAGGQKCKAGEKAVSWDQPGVSWLGTWSPAIRYVVNDAVVFDGLSYLAVAANSAEPPSTNPGAWSVLAGTGPAGKAGRRGPVGGGLMPGQLALGIGIPAVFGGASYGFSSPQQMAFDGAHLWVANGSSDSVTEVGASAGSLIRTLSGGKYGFDGPGPIAFEGKHLWIANSHGGSVTEVNASDGSWVRTISDASNSNYGFTAPVGIAFDGTHLWITNLGGAGGGGSVTEVNASDGSWVRTLSGGSYGFDGPQGVAFDGVHIWVANGVGSTVTEVNASNGSWVRTLSGGSYGFSTPSAIAFDGTHLWLTNLGTPGSVTEVNASDGSWVRTLSGGSYGFSNPYQLAFDGTHMWITNSEGNSVTEINASDGSWVRTFSGGSYGFNGPQYIAFDGTHMWVTSKNSLTAFQG